MDPIRTTYEQADEVQAKPTDSTSLLASLDRRRTSQSVGDVPDRKWVEEVLAGHTETSWRKEVLVIIKSGLPLIATFSLQYSLIVASIFSLGHVGKIELGGVTLGVMSGNITGYAVYMGFATSLDTLCAQAYGSGKKELVGIYVQRMLVLLGLLTIPIAVLWWFSEPILVLIIPDKEVAYLASRYLRILIAGAPAYAAFECGKRFLQAQGLFAASTYIMIICAPLNAFMNWFFVWKLNWGFNGAPIAVVITNNLLALGLVAYVYFIAGSECWGGFSKRALQNWGPMIYLAIPGFILLEAEFLAFELLTFASSHISTTSLAAQSILHTIAATMYQIPFPLSIAGSTRIGNLIGATLHKSAQITMKATFTISLITGALNMIIISTLRYRFPRLFSDEEDVIALAAQALPVVATFQLWDAIAANSNGVLRGVGRQKIAGYISLFCYYVVAMPISFATTFRLDWGLKGLWCGVAIGLACVCAIELLYIWYLDWEKCVDEATKRNASG